MFIPLKMVCIGIDPYPNDLSNKPLIKRWGFLANVESPTWNPCSGQGFPTLRRAAKRDSIAARVDGIRVSPKRRRIIATKRS